MAECEKCIHFKKCRYFHHKEKVCENFTDKSRVVVLPCAVGDTVYFCLGGSVYPATIAKVIINNYTNPPIWIELDSKVCNFGVKRWDLVIGKEIFRTREDAEKALRECNNE